MALAGPFPVSLPLSLLFIRPFVLSYAAYTNDCVQSRKPLMRSFYTIFIWLTLQFLNISSDLLITQVIIFFPVISVLPIIWTVIILLPNSWGFSGWLCSGFEEAGISVTGTVVKLWTLQFRLHLLRLRLLHFVVHVSPLLLRTASSHCKLSVCDVAVYILWDFIW